MDFLPAWAAIAAMGILIGVLVTLALSDWASARRRKRRDDET
jgi:hypothetical protein